MVRHVNNDALYAALAALIQQRFLDLIRGLVVQDFVPAGGRDQFGQDQNRLLSIIVLQVCFVKK